MCGIGNQRGFCCFSLCGGTIAYSIFLIVAGSIDIAGSAGTARITFGIITVCLGVYLIFCVILKLGLFLLLGSGVVLTYAFLLIIPIVQAWNIWNTLMDNGAPLSGWWITQTILWSMTILFNLSVTNGLFSCALVLRSGVATGWDYMTPKEAKMKQNLKEQVFDEGQVAAAQNITEARKEGEMAAKV